MLVTKNIDRSEPYQEFSTQEGPIKNKNTRPYRGPFQPFSKHKLNMKIVRGRAK